MCPSWTWRRRTVIKKIKVGEKPWGVLVVGK